MGDKIKSFLRKNKKNILNIFLVLLLLAAVSLVSMLALWAFDIIYFDDGMQINVELFESFKNSWYGWIIVILFQVIMTMLLCFIPAFSMACILLVQTLYTEPWEAFVIAFSAVMLTSMVMYLMGRFGGYKLCSKIIGEGDCKKASELLNEKGLVFFPLMMMFPIFPDDALVMIAGTLKMSLKWFIPSIVLGRGIGVVTIVFGLGSIPFDKFSSPWHWIGFLVLSAAFLSAVFFGAYKLNNYIQSKNKKDK